MTKKIALFVLFVCSYVGSSCGSSALDDGDCKVDSDCSGSMVCINQTCVPAGVECGESRCAPDQICVEEQCFPTSCGDRLCPGVGDKCQDGECVSASCLGVDCPEGLRCADGLCYPEDCDTKVCPGYGEVCVDDECVQYSCVGVECAIDEACANGLCYPVVCDDQPCGPDEVCTNQGCVEKSCAGLFCPDGEICVHGQCWVQPCPGEECREGNLCRQTQCPEGGYTCILSDEAWQWSATETACDDGDLCTESDQCLDGLCVGTAMVCVDAPAATCQSVDELLEYLSPGSCQAGACVYEEVTVTCSDICANDACQESACAGIECLDPPANVCLGDRLQRAYHAVGQCVDGDCKYSYVDQNCPGDQLCREGQCVAPTSCSLAMTPSTGTVETNFSWTHSSNGSSCTWSYDGEDQGVIDCIGGDSFLGSVVGEGTHSWTLYVLDGPSGPTQCSDQITVTELSSCDLTMTPSSGTVETNFSWTHTSNGTSCTWSYNGEDQGMIDCIGGDSFLGSMVGAGTHSWTINVLEGPSGPTSCSDQITVTEVTSCELTMTPATGTVDTTFTWSSSSNGSSCTWSLNGTDNGPIDCTGGDIFKGSLVGVGTHTWVLSVVDGPSGPSSCSASITVN